MKFVIRNETYDFDLLIVIGGTRNQAFQHYKKLMHDTSSSQADNHPSLGTTFTAPHLGFACCIYLQHKPRTPDTIATLAHEALHVARHIARLGRISGEETQAYLIGWIVRSVLLKIKKK